MALCERGVERNRGWLEEEEDHVGKVTEFWDYDSPLETVLSFKYLGSLPMETDEDWPECIANIRKASKIWSRLDEITGQ